MIEKKQQARRFRSWMVVSLLLMSFTVLMAGTPQEQTLTRGKFWYSTMGAGIVTNGGVYALQLAYPGYYSAINIQPAVVEQGPYWIIGGTKVMAAPGPRGTPSFADAIVPNTLHINYNFTGEGGITEPEEWTYSELEWYAQSQVIEGARQGKLLVKNKDMCWSVPKYDDFIICEYTAINNDTETLEDFYFTYHFPLRSILNTKNDDEYLWDEDMQGFIFYDDTSWPVNEANPIEYLISPGNVTGDRGDPGNIWTVGSLDRRLYSPHLVTANILDPTPNKNGEAKVYLNISSQNEEGEHNISASGTPEREFHQTWTEDYDIKVKQSTREQEQRSWREMWDDATNPRDGTVDGSKWERSPFLMVTIGPYDLEPGNEISWKWIYCWGEMDRNISQLGGLPATENFLAEGLENIRANWEAAMELINNNYQLPADAYPPPTCGTAPFVATDNNKLEATPFSEIVDGQATQGFDLSWMAVPSSYGDPGTGEDDFAGYKIYQSEIHITGPWIEIVDLTRQEAEAYRQGDRIVYRVTVEPGVPYRYAVTSYDTHGLESGMTAYTYYAQAAQRAPSNNMSTIKVVPNPFRQRSGLLDPGENNRISFVNVPAKCTIRIYTLAGDRVKTIEHDGLGETVWGEGEYNTYMLTDFSDNVAPGLYIYHVESHVAGHEGETHIGKFMIIR